MSRIASLFTGTLVILFCSPTSSSVIANEQPSPQVLAYYNSWRDAYLTISDRVEGGALIDYQNNRTTCSEALGYGMLATVYFAGENESQAKADFKALNRFRKAFPSNVDGRLMAWRIEDDSDVPVETACATDGDLDIAFALLLAGQKWDDSNLLSEGLALVTAIRETLVRDDFSLRRGDWDVTQHAVRLSDVMPTHFRLFGTVDDADFWNAVEQMHYEIIEETMGQHGAFPDFVIFSDDSWQPAPPNFLESPHDGEFYYNACRVPWRLAAAALEHDCENARSILATFGGGIGKVENHDFKAGYQHDGSPVNTWTDGAFTAPHLVSLMVNDRSPEMRSAFAAHLTARENYYADSIRLFCLELCDRFSNRSEKKD
ncbi:MAG: glycosyl hydrolase family 8 [Verrucomicrobiota bacterium]